MIPYFDSPESLARLDATVDSWIGTGFREHWRAKGFGVDCIQAMIAIYTEVGLIDSASTPPYSIGAWKGLRKSPVAEWLDQCPKFQPVETSAILPGDLLSFTQGRVAYHLACYVDRGAKLFAHAVKVDGFCLHGLHDPVAASRLLSAYRPVKA